MVSEEVSDLPESMASADQLILLVPTRLAQASTLWPGVAQTALSVWLLDAKGFEESYLMTFFQRKVGFCDGTFTWETSFV